MSAPHCGARNIGKTPNCVRANSDYRQSSA